MILVVLYLICLVRYRKPQIYDGCHTQSTKVVTHCHVNGLIKTVPKYPTSSTCVVVSSKVLFARMSQTDKPVMP